MSGIGFGLERIGLVALRRPMSAGAVIAVLLALLSAGTPRLEFEADFERTFRPPASPAGDEATPVVGTLSDNVAILIDAELRDAAILEELRLFQLELLLNEEIAAVHSIFSLRRPAADRTEWEAYFPDGVEPGPRIDELRRDPDTRDILARLLSADADMTAMVVIPARIGGSLVGGRRLTQIVSDAIADHQGGGVRFEIAGRTAIGSAVVAAIRRDHVVITLLGLAVGVLCGILVFRSVAFAVLAVVPGMTAIAGMFGFMGTAGFKVTVLTSAVTALVLVITVADTMHMCIDWLRRRERGEGPAEGLRGSVHTIGPACALTSLTTIAAFLSMSIVDSPGIRELSFVGAAGCAFAFVAVVVVFPLTALAWSAMGFRPPPWHGFTAVTKRRWFRPLPTRLSTPVVALAMIVSMGALYAHAHLTPKFNLLYSVPRDAPIQAATARADAAFGGLSSVAVELTAPAGTDFRSDDIWRHLVEAARIAGKIAGPERIFGLPRLLSDRDEAARAALLEPILDADGSGAAAALITPDARTAVLTVFVETGRPYHELLHLAERLRSGLSTLPLTVRVGGSAVLTARESDRVIGALHRNLLFATAFTIVVIGAGFRSLRYAAAALLPNALPILLMGASLAVSGIGLQFSTAIALIIAFGIAVDDTIHFLNRYRQRAEAGGGRGAAVDRTFQDIAVVLMATTLLLCAGLSTTLTSAIPALRQYGYLSIATLVVALVCLLVILPAVIHRIRPDEEPGMGRT